MMVECHSLCVDEIKGLYLVSVRAVTEQEYANETKIQNSLAEILGASLVPSVLCMHLWFLEPCEKCTLPGSLLGKDNRSLHSASLDTGCETDIGCDGYSHVNAVGKLCPSPVIN